MRMGKAAEEIPMALAFPRKWLSRRSQIINTLPSTELEELSLYS